jgi:hypothetical protein
MATWTTPRTWVAGEQVTASLMNTFVRDDFAYLKDAPTFDGNVTVSGTLAVTGAATFTSTINSQTISSSANLTGSLAVATSLNLSAAGAGQIVFPASQNASTNANTLDDYEEGVWTPVIGGSGGTSGQAYSVQVGVYTKIGKMVFCQFRAQLSTLGTVTTNVQIQGLPFTSENTANQSSVINIGYWTNLTTALVKLGGELNPNATAVTLRGAGAAAVTLSALVQGDLSNTTYLDGFIAYRATA